VSDEALSGGEAAVADAFVLDTGDSGAASPGARARSPRGPGLWRWFRRQIERDPSLAVLSGFSLLGSGAITYVAIFPFSPLAPVRFYGIAAPCVAFLAIAFFFLPDRLTTLATHVGVLLSIGMLGAFIATTQTADGMALSIFWFQWVGVYVAYFFAIRVVLTYMALVVISMAIAFDVAVIQYKVVAQIWIVFTLVGICLVVCFIVERLRRAATHDQLTGLLNRTGFQAASERLLAQSRRRSTPVALGVIDIDNFKSVNDSLGHVAADDLLESLARTWLRAFRSRDVVARYGGDEFVVLLPEMHASDARDRLDQIRQTSPLAWSHGVAELAPGESLLDALSRADRDLYFTKNAQKGFARPDPE
jgi:diguanylate cyclase (GGDEF)-like protein